MRFDMQDAKPRGGGADPQGVLIMEGGGCRLPRLVKETTGSRLGLWLMREHQGSCLRVTTAVEDEDDDNPPPAFGLARDGNFSGGD